jgi:hypothetical protein
MTQSKNSNFFVYSLGCLFWFLVISAIGMGEESKPELPVIVLCYVNKEIIDKPYIGFFDIEYQKITADANVVDFWNYSQDALKVRVDLKNKGLQQSENHYITLPPGLIYHMAGYIKFWNFVSKEEMTLSHPEYRDRKIILDFSKTKRELFDSKAGDLKYMNPNAIKTTEKLLKQYEAKDSEKSSSK